VDGMGKLVIINHVQLHQLRMSILQILCAEHTILDVQFLIQVKDVSQ
jgi:hypothetical protein